MMTYDQFFYMYLVLGACPMLLALYVICRFQKKVMEDLRYCLELCTCCTGNLKSTFTAFFRRVGGDRPVWWSQTKNRIASRCPGLSYCRAWLEDRCPFFSGRRGGVSNDNLVHDSHACGDHVNGVVSVSDREPASPAPSPSPNRSRLSLPPPPLPARRARVERKISTFNCDKYNDPFKYLEKFEEWRMKVQTAARNVPSKSIRREELEQYLTRVVHSTLTIDNEYQSTPKGFNISTSIATLPENKRKNRYQNNLPYNNTRIVLRRTPVGTGTDYLNASYIRSYRKSKAYIATQGPKDANESTLDDFWSMVWENNTNIIVMVASVIEGQRVKVSQYWPDAPGQKHQYGMVSVELTKQEDKLDYIKRCFLLSCEGKSWEVQHFQFTAWPDHSKPKTASSFTLMVKNIRQLGRTGPIVVHCSAGIGRTGTLLMVMILLDQLEGCGVLDPLRTLIALRLGRARLVDNLAQYQFAHEVLLEFLYGDVTSFPVESFPEELERIRDRLEGQFQKLKSYQRRLRTNWGSYPQHARMNRHQNILPVDGRQIFLQQLRGLGVTQYVNAVQVEGVSPDDTVIVAEHPQRHTLQRVWRMIYEKRVTTWLLLHTHPHDNQEYPEVLPTSGHVKTNLFSITIDSVGYHRSYTETSVILDTIKVSPSPPHKLRVLQLLGWDPEKELPTETLPLLLLLQCLRRIRASDPAGPTVITCRDGFTACGVTAALNLVLSRLQLRQEVDVYNAVHEILFDRPQFIVSPRQYVFVHDAVVAYLMKRDANGDLDDDLTKTDSQLCVQDEDKFLEEKRASSEVL